MAKWLGVIDSIRIDKKDGKRPDIKLGKGEFNGFCT
jgi:hypothetical protein